MATNSETPTGGSMGHHGRDRQPAKSHIKNIEAEAPNEKEAAHPAEVHARSKSASTPRPHSHPDPIRPEPHAKDEPQK